MSIDRRVSIEPLAADPVAMRTVVAAASPRGASQNKICGLDVGSTTCKYVLSSGDGHSLAQAYEPHNAKQAEKVFEFLVQLEPHYHLTPGQDRIFFTGSGAVIIAPPVGV